jgi:adenosyl cobinamide kinase/adenosyl cobinamide phosphate guanylyltransferase
MLTVLLGGARSGKSRLAERLGVTAEGDGSPVAYIATAPHIPGDDDLDRRIDRHRQERPASWMTIEEETDLVAALSRTGDAFVIVDCLTVWVGNLVHHGVDEASVLAACDAAIAVASARDATTVVVTNEVGMGIVPADALTREYRDLLGRVNQRWVTASDRALLLVAGRALALHDPEMLLR